MRVNGLATVIDVGLEHIRKLIESRLISAHDGGKISSGLGSALGVGDGDRSTIHVHLTITNLVEPGPGKDGVSLGEVLGDSEGELTGTAAVGIGRQVALDTLGRTSTDDGVNDLEDTVLARVLVVRDADLARSTAVDRTAGKGQRLGGAERHDVVGALRVVDA